MIQHPALTYNLLLCSTGTLPLYLHCYLSLPPFFQHQKLPPSQPCFYIPHYNPPAVDIHHNLSIKSPPTSFLPHLYFPFPFCICILPPETTPRRNASSRQGLCIARLSRLKRQGLSREGPANRVCRSRQVISKGQAQKPQRAKGPPGSTPFRESPLRDRLWEAHPGWPILCAPARCNRA
jgi:hypothetical protein